MQQIRRILTHNWLTKLFSLLIAALLWATISSETTSEIGMTVPLEYRNIPPQVEVTGDATNNIEVRLRGASSLIKEISPRDVSAALDLGSMGPGERIVQLTAQNVKTPVGIEVVRLNPSRVRLDIDRTVSKIVPITARIEGVPAPGFAVTDSKTMPDSIEIEGPESKVRAMESVSTVPVHVNGREKDFSQIVDIDVSDPVIRLRSATASVEVQVHIAQDSGRPKHQRQSR